MGITIMDMDMNTTTPMGTTMTTNSSMAIRGASIPTPAAPTIAITICVRHLSTFSPTLPFPF